MYADRYGPKPINPGSLTLSVGIVGGLVAAAMLSSTVIDTLRPPKTITLIDVAPPPPPPPPETPPPRETPIELPETRVTPPIQIVPVTPVQPAIFDPGPSIDPPIGTGTGTGAGPAVDVEPVRPPAPVLVGAQPDPRYTRDFQPTYPSEERRAGHEGVVTLRVLIGVDGRVRQVERLLSPSEAFWRATQTQALSRWRFRPATRDGVPYEVWRQMTVRFRMETE